MSAAKNWCRKIASCFRSASEARHRNRRTASTSFSEPLEARVVLSAPDIYETDNTAATARAIGPTEQQSGRTLHTGTDVDWVAFDIPALSNVILETSGPRGDTLLDLYGPNSSTTRIATDDDSGEGQFSRISTSLNPGRYFARVSEYGQNDTIADYALRLQVAPALPDAFEPDNSAAQARNITVNASAQSRSLHMGRDEDWVKFHLTEPMLVTLETSGSAGDTVLELYAADGRRLLARDHDSGVGEFSRIQQPLESGTYLARISEYGQDHPVTAYSLQVSGTALATLRDGYEANDSRGQATVLPLNSSPQRHSLHRPLDADWLRFEVLQTSQVQGSIRVGSSQFGWPQLALYRGDAATPVITTTSMSFTRVLEPGTWYVAVTEDQADGIVAEYSIQMQAVVVPDLVVSSASAGAGPITVGSPVMLEWTVANIATNPLIGGFWRDTIYLSADHQLGGDTEVGRLDAASGMGASQQRTSSLRLPITTDPAWAGREAWLLFVTDTDRSLTEASESNNLRSVPIRFSSFVGLESPFADEYFTSGAAMEVRFRAVDATGRSTVRIAVDGDSLPDNNSGHTYLSSTTPLRATAGNQLQTVSLRLPSLPARTAPWHVWAEIQTDGNIRRSAPIPIRILERAATSNDQLSDAVGGRGYEVFGIDAGQMSGQLTFRVRTNYLPEKPFNGNDRGGGDLRLQMGNETWAIAVNTHSTANGQVNAGDLYAGATFEPGRTVSSVPSFVSGYSQRISGRSSVSFTEVSGKPWRYEIQAFVDVATLPAAANAGVTATWAMYCGNDTDDVTLIPDRAAPPVPDVLLTDFRTEASGQLSWRYAIQGGALPQSATASIFWTDSGGRPISNALWNGTTAVAVGEYQPEAVHLTGLDDRPEQATALSLILDPQNQIRERSEFNNRREISPPDPDDQIAEAIRTEFSDGSVTRSGRLSNYDVDMYSVTVLAGQKLSFDFDSRFVLGALRIFDANGRELVPETGGLQVRGGDGFKATRGVSVHGQRQTLRESSADLATQPFLEVQFPASGTWYVGVSRAGNVAYNAVSGEGDASSPGPAGQIDYQLIVTQLVSLPQAATGPSTVTGVIRMPNPNGHRPSINVSLSAVDGAPIRSGAMTWLVIHGRVSNSEAFRALASALRNTTGQQVLLLDWAQGAEDNTADHLLGLDGIAGAEWIPYVADWASTYLASIGIRGQQLNLAGHSWGSYVAARIAAPERSGNVNAIVAMDPARAGIGFNGAGDREDQINFGRLARMSWAFYGNGSFGNSAIAATATESFTVTSDDFSNNTWNPKTVALRRHIAPHHLFLQIVTRPYALAGTMTLSRLLNGRRHPNFTVDAFSAETSVSERWLGSGPLAYEGRFAVRRTTGQPGFDEFWTMDSLEFLDQRTKQPRIVNAGS